MIEILDAGPQTTVQDLGRCGQLRSGIPPSGAMDRFAFVVANRLAGNGDTAAALECTLLGPRFAVATTCAIAVTGAAMPIAVNGVEAPAWTTLVLHPGDVVKLGSARAGLRAYVAFGGGLDVPLALGSRATYLRGGLGGLHGRSLKKGDRLNIVRCCVPARRRVRRDALPSYPSEVSLRAILGPQHDRFTAAGIAAFCSGAYELLPQSDRMGVRLRGERIEHARGHDIVSDGIALGSVQVPGDGQPIVLMADRQSTGGYTKLATVCSFDIGRLGQLRPGQRVRFSPVSIDEAHRLLRASDEALTRLTLEEIA
ncbi:MAG: biotin-dependent carboxyltransferase [Burkholderiales bacterium]|nr:biotin-dependent carboxyltransferase [Burkholderiales bacterium]